MNNPYIQQINFIKNEVCKLLPYGIDTTAELLLGYMSHSNDERLRDTAAYVKASKKSNGIKAFFDFSMSLLHDDVVPLSERLYDMGLDGIKELKDYTADKFVKDEREKNNMKIHVFINWLILKLPAKEEMKRLRLIY